MLLITEDSVIAVSLIIDGLVEMDFYCEELSVRSKLRVKLPYFDHIRDLVKHTSAK